MKYECCLIVTKCIALRCFMFEGCCQEINLVRSIKISMSCIEMHTQSNASWFKFPHYFAMLRTPIYMHNLRKFRFGWVCNWIKTSSHMTSLVNLEHSNKREEQWINCFTRIKAVVQLCLSELYQFSFLISCQKRKLWIRKLSQTTSSSYCQELGKQNNLKLKSLKADKRGKSAMACMATSLMLQFSEC